MYSFENSMGRLTFQVSVNIGLILKKRFRDAGYDLNQFEWSVISFLKRKKICNQKDIACFLGTYKIKAKRIVDRLQEKNIVNKEKPAGKRSLRISLTSKGEKVFRELEKHATETLLQAYGDISKGSVTDCIETLKLILENLEKAEK